MERTGGRLAQPEVVATAVECGPDDEPGRARATIKGREWEVLDYRDRLPATEELAGRVRSLQEGQPEERQCVFINTAAAYLIAQKIKGGGRPEAVSMKEVMEEAQR